MSVLKLIAFSQHGSSLSHKTKGIDGSYDDCMVKEGPFSHNIPS